MSEADLPPSAPHFLRGDSDVAALMRGHDWSGSPLGPPERWPRELRSIVALMLASKFPMFVAWGDELGFLYNDPYAEILGTKHPAALGLPFHDIWSEIWADISPLIAAALRGEATYRENWPLTMNRRGFPEETWFTFSYSPVYHDDGTVAGMFCACTETTAVMIAEAGMRDLAVTLEKRVAAALAERKLLADIVEHTDAFVQVADRNFRFLAINDASAKEFERVFGIRPEVGDSMLDLLADRPEHQADVRAIWSRALAGEEFTEVAEFGDPNRARRHYEIKFNALRDAEGELIGAYQFVHDVTSRVEGERRLRETQDALRQSQKLKTLGQITGGVAHDFNNLLTPIVGSLDLIRRRHDDDPRMARLLDGALQAADRASTLVQRLLAFSRRQVLRPRATAVAELVEGMSELIRRSIGPRIAVELDFAPDLRLAQVDPNQLELALLNLAVNARDAMDGVGTLRISARNETLGDRPALDAGTYVRLDVSDDGRGMDAETLQRATEPFFTTKDVGHGTGLGLSSVSGLVAQSGGDFALASEIGKGTTATLWLPETVDTGEVSTAKRSSAPQEARSAAVLLVDDEPLVRHGAAEMLADGGFVVASAASGGEALKMLADGVAAEILVTDYAMPGMTGIELAQQARAMRPGLKVLLISGYPAEAEADDQLKTIPRLDKPFRQDELLRALAELG